MTTTSSTTATMGSGGGCAASVASDTAGRPSVRLLVLLAGGYLFWGTAQTVSLKWTDRLAAPGHKAVVHTPLTHTTTAAAAAQDAAGVVQPSSTVELTPHHLFAHPFTQVLFMFTAEALCLVVFAAMLLRRRYGAVLLHAWRHARRGSHQGSNSNSTAAVAVVKDDEDDADAVVVRPARLRRGVDVSLPCNPCVWLLTSGADLLASVVQNVGMTLTTASLFQMLRGATVVWVAAISHVWLHRRFVKVELWGIACVVVGLTLVGLSTLTRTPHANNTTTATTAAAAAAAASDASLQTLGNVLVICAQVMHAYQGVCQERLVRLYKVPPLQMVGIEGVYGVCLTLMLLALLQLVRTSTWGHDIVALRVRATTVPLRLPSPQHGGSSGSVDTVPAVTLVTLHNWARGLDDASTRSTTQMLYTNVSWLFAGGGGGGDHVIAAASSSPLAAVRAAVPFDDVVLAFEQLSQSALCGVAVAIYVLSSFLYNALQMYIIQYMSVAATVMIGSLRNVTVWAFCLLWPDVFAETFNVVQFAGFVFLLFGNVLFQRVWFSRFDDVLPRSVVDACPWLLRDRV